MSICRSVVDSDVDQRDAMVIREVLLAPNDILQAEPKPDLNPNTAIMPGYLGNRYQVYTQSKYVWPHPDALRTAK